MSRSTCPLERPDQAEGHVGLRWDVRLWFVQTLHVPPPVNQADNTDRPELACQHQPPSATPTPRTEIRGQIVIPEYFRDWLEHCLVCQIFSQFLSLLFSFIQGFVSAKVRTFSVTSWQSAGAGCGEARSARPCPSWWPLSSLSSLSSHLSSTALLQSTAPRRHSLPVIKMNHDPFILEISLSSYSFSVIVSLLCF